MNPYYPLDNYGEFAIVFTLSVLVIACGAFITKHFSAFEQPEACLRGAVVGLQLLNVVVLIVEILGLLGFALGVKSLLWYFWIFPFLASIVGTFKVFPIIGIGLFAWWVVGRRNRSYSTRLLLIIVKCFTLNAICAGMYFLDEWMMAR